MNIEQASVRQIFSRKVQTDKTGKLTLTKAREKKVREKSISINPDHTQYVHQKNPTHASQHASVITIIVTPDQRLYVNDCRAGDATAAT